MHVLTREQEQFDPLLRRAFSVARLHDDGFDLVYRVGGKGTQALSRLLPGAFVDVLGPLGCPFHTGQLEAGSQPLWLVGGGVGVPPLAMLAQQQMHAVGQMINGFKAFVGARTGGELLCLDDLTDAGMDISTATEDGSVGARGYVTQLLEQHLSRHLSGSEIKPMVCACGPTPMLRAVAEICARFQVPCQVSLEESMPCGIGVCNGCVVAVNNATDDYGTYQRLCVQGPVLWAHEIAW